MAEVLVVDPGELGELLAALLGQYGIAASHARSGEEALERALVDKPQVAIIEHELADAPGVDVAELLRAELRCKVILTYAQSLVAEADDAVLKRIGSMDASFARPFRSLTLVEAAAKLMGRDLKGPTSTAPTSTEGPALSSAEGTAVEDGDELVLDVEVSDKPDTSVIVSGEGPALDALGPAPPLEERIAGQAFSPGALGDLWQRVKERRRAEPEHRGPVGEGELNPRALADMLDAFHQSQTTGELWLTHERSRRVLLLRRGVVVGARSNIESEDLTTLAVRRGAMSIEDFELVRDDVLSGLKKTVVDSILSHGLLPEETLRALVAEQAKRIALGAFRWHEGTMKVTLEGRATREPVPVRVPVGDIIVRGILLTEGDDALKAAAPDDARFSPAADSGYGLEDLTLSSDEARAVISMDGTKTIKDLITLFSPGIPDRTIRGLASGLLCLNLVRFVGWGPAEARRISFF
jgi:CheY-like chemotaxis protein